MSILLILNYSRMLDYDQSIRSLFKSFFSVLHYSSPLQERSQQHRFLPGSFFASSCLTQPHLSFLSLRDRSSRFFGTGVCWIMAKIAGAEPPSEPSMCVALRGSYTGSIGVSQQMARSIRVSGFLQPSSGPNKRSSILFVAGFTRSWFHFASRRQLAEQTRHPFLKTESSTRSGSG